MSCATGIPNDERCQRRECPIAAIQPAAKIVKQLRRGVCPPICKNHQNFTTESLPKTLCPMPYQTNHITTIIPTDKMSVSTAAEQHPNSSAATAYGHHNGNVTTAQEQHNSKPTTALQQHYSSKNNYQTNIK
jgi:hypothetical protein